MPRRISTPKQKRIDANRRARSGMTYRDMRKQELDDLLVKYVTMQKDWRYDDYMRKVFDNLYVLSDLLKYNNQGLRTIINEWTGDDPHPKETREGLMVIIMRTQVKEVRHHVNVRAEQIREHQAREANETRGRTLQGQRRQRRITLRRGRDENAD